MLKCIAQIYRVSLALAILIVLDGGVQSAKAFDLPSSPEFTVIYSYKQGSNGTTEIFPIVPYLETLKSSVPIPILPWQPCCLGFFSFEFPKLSVKSINSTNNPVYFSEIVFNVEDSSINSEPVLLAQRNFGGVVSIFNEGWGRVHDPSLKFDLKIEDFGSGGDLDFGSRKVPPNRPTDTPLAIQKTVTLKDFDDGTYFSFVKLVPELPPTNQYTKGSVTAVLSYKTDDGSERSFAFDGTLNFGPALLPFIPPSPILYDVKLLAGVAPTTIRVPISQLVSPGGADHFVLRVSSDRSARFDFSINLKAVDGKTFPAGKFRLDTFVPRSSARFIQQATVNVEFRRSRAPMWKGRFPPN